MILSYFKRKCMNNSVKKSYIIIFSIIPSILRYESFSSGRISLWCLRNVGVRETNYIRFINLRMCNPFYISLHSYSVSVLNTSDDTSRGLQVQLKLSWEVIILKGGSFLGGGGGVVVPSPKIVINLFRSYENLHLKENHIGSAVQILL